MTASGRPDLPPTLYSYADAGRYAPSPAARWAVRVQSGDDDPQPRVLAYAVSELCAKRLVLALKRSDRIDTRHAGRWGTPGGRDPRALRRPHLTLPSISARVVPRGHG